MRTSTETLVPPKPRYGSNLIGYDFQRIVQTACRLVDSRPIWQPSAEADLIFATHTYPLQRAYAIHGEQIEEIGSGFKDITPFQQAGSLLYFKTKGPTSEVMYRTDGTREGTFQSPDFCYPGSCT